MISNGGGIYPDGVDLLLECRPESTGARNIKAW